MSRKIYIAWEGEEWNPEEAALEVAMEMEIVSPVAAEDGSVYIDENGAMYSL